MHLELIGPHPFERDANGQQRTRIGTLFPPFRALYTEVPGVHAQQRVGFIERVNSERSGQGLPPLNGEEEEQLCAESVDLIFESDQILIRPNPNRMDLAFQADELLWEFVSKRKVKFLLLSDPRVSEAIKERGELWRLSSIPKTREGKKAWVYNSKVAIENLPIYFYNRLTGTRYLTYDEFEKLGRLDKWRLACHLREIADYSARRNRLGRPELDFFAADLRAFGPRRFENRDFLQLAPDTLCAAYDELRERFRTAVHESFRKDDCDNKAWCQRVIQALFLEGNESQAESLPSGLSREFFLQIEWLPGGRFAEGEFLIDRVFDDALEHRGDAGLQQLCDPKAKGFIFNILREYGDLESINIGRLPESLSLGRPQSRGRRGVYLAEFQSRSQPQPIKRFIRLQKWGVWEHLDQGKDLLQSIFESEEYTDYYLDRRLGCQQLGMHLASRVCLRRLSEKYQGENPRFHTTPIHTPYFERDYLEGVATDKIPPEQYARPDFALRLAPLLGKAAASSLIVGRALDLGRRPVFDDGDEVVIEDAQGLPDDIFVADHNGAFGEYKLPMEAFAEHYAQPVYRREKFLPDAREFAALYLEALRMQFLRVQADYRKRRRAFDTLFKDCKYDLAGSFAYRWERVLKRLDATDAENLVVSIRDKIWVLREVEAA